jgi:hypothetical protein
MSKEEVGMVRCSFESGVLQRYVGIEGEGEGGGKKLRLRSEMRRVRPGG